MTPFEAIEGGIRLLQSRCAEAGVEAPGEITLPSKTYVAVMRSLPRYVIFEGNTCRPEICGVKIREAE